MTIKNDPLQIIQPFVKWESVRLPIQFHQQINHHRRGLFHPFQHLTQDLNGKHRVHNNT